MKFFVILLFSTLIFNGCSTTSIKSDVNVPSNKGVAVKSVVVEEIKAPNESAAREVRNMIISKLESYGHVAVKSHTAQAILSGELSMTPLKTHFWTKKEERTDEETEEKKLVLVYLIEAERTITLSYELLVDGKVTADSYSKTYSGQWRGDSYSEAQRQIPSESHINASLIPTLALNVARDISPHQVSMNFNFHHGKKDNNIKLGITYVENQRYEQALSIFKQVSVKSDQLHNRAAALYNMGLIYEMQGKFKNAFEHYTRANQIAPSEKDYIQALSRAEQRKQLNDQYLQQLGN